MAMWSASGCVRFSRDALPFAGLVRPSGPAWSHEKKCDDERVRANTSWSTIGAGLTLSVVAAVIMPTAYVLKWAIARLSLSAKELSVPSTRKHVTSERRHSQAELAGASERLTVMAMALAKAKMNFER
jgi:hypothetical protein